MLSENITDKMKLEKSFYLQNQLKDIFSWNELEKLLNLRPFISDSRFTVASKEGGHWEWPFQSWLSDVNTYPPKLLNELINNNTCYLSDCSRVNKNINDICGQIESLCGWHVDAHIYFSTKINQYGFGKHKDKQHNLIVQIEGQSTVKVWSGDDVIIDNTMEPGDIVFIPKHVFHQIIPKTKRLSVSFPCDTTIHNFAEPQDRHWIKVL